MTVISSSLVLSLQAINENAGLICYQTVASAANISATSFLTSGSTSFPASNMANPATSYGWEAADTTDQTITIDNPAASEIDYIGIARHNLGQAGVEVQIRFNGSVVRQYSPVSSSPSLLFLFQSATPSTIQIDIRGASNAAKIAVLYVGKALKLERNLYVGHSPIVYGRERSTMNGVSQQGEYLGEIVLNETLSTTVDLQNLTPLWYRESLDPFFALRPRRPCFFAWRPGTYPTEVAYCWPTGSPRPYNQRPNGMMNISFSLTGIGSNE